MRPIPAAFARRMAEVDGATGAEWVQRLPALLDEYAAHWRLRLTPPFEPLSYNYVAPASRDDGTEVVLKAGVPTAELLAEAAALRAYDGRGAVRLIEAEAERGVLLLERVRPGTPLVELADDDEATRIAAAVMRQLWRPPPFDHPFPTVAGWLRGFDRLRATFDGGTGPFPSRLVEMAEGLARDLVASSSAPVLLHGDLHHRNILAARRGPWLALDPKGVLGEPAYETGALLRNPMPALLSWPSPGRVLARRVGILSEELGLDHQRVAGWAASQAVLSAWWTYEDHGSVGDSALACATLLFKILDSLRAE